MLVAKEDAAFNGYAQLSQQDVKAQFLRSLESISPQRSFAAFGKLVDFADPQIYTSSTGRVHLPLQEQSARALIETSHRAPFGKREQTLIDTSVRNTWELSPNHFELQNPTWAKYIKKITRSAVEELGFAPDDALGVRAELYKLLLYEKGALFRPHQEYDNPDITQWMRYSLTLA
jgi:hypothetical protein